MAKRRKSKRKTYRKKTSAKRAARARGGSVYKVKGGYRISRRKRKKRRRGNPGPWAAAGSR